MAFSVALPAQSPVPTNPAIERRVNQMLAKISLDDKLALLGGEDRFYTHAVASIGLPRLKMSDGPVGVRTFGPAPAYAAGVALAASWDPVLAERVGASLGEDARARGVNFLLAPAVNIYRYPLNGRNMEYLGEDPYLASRVAVGYIDGVQSKGVSATVKHFAANNSEYDRHRINAVIDERTLRELYLPVFEAAVRQAHAGAVMDSYNLVNGEHSTQNRHLNLDILKGEWGFQGVLMSDWDATYDGVAAANNGLDLEMPYAKWMTPATLKAALADGRVQQSTIDDKVRRILRTALQFGWLDREQLDTTIPLDNPAADPVALDEARESITLLKNQGNLLPLHADRMKSIAVIGPESVQAVVGGGGSSKTTPFDAQGLVAGLASYLGQRVKVMYAPGLLSHGEMFRETTLHQLTLETRSGSKEAPPAVEKNLQIINYWDGEGKPLAPQTGTKTYYTWNGEYDPSTGGEYRIVIAAPSRDSYRLVLDGVQVLSRSSGQGSRTLASKEVKLTAHHPVHVRLEYETTGAAAEIGFGMQALADLLSPQAQQIIRQADAAVVAVGFDETTEGEGFDRTFQLPGMQDELISRVAALNPRTIVAITAGGAVATQPWIGLVPVLLDTYYSGQEGTRALAEVLFGERSPEGHLPFSWERVLADNPASSHYEEEDGGRDSHYAEGLYVGYRYYTSKHKTPLFPFGYGLSYTSFAYSGLAVRRNSPDDAEVSFDVENKGSRAGATVAQVYVGDPSAKIARPVMELKQFEKVRLGPGARQHVVLHLNRRAFEYYDVAGHGWRLDPGTFTIFVGQSSEDIDLTKNLDMR
jgi:beta-glucosidase